MFSALGSSPRVRLGPITNTQGLPPNRLPILASPGPRMHAPLRNVLRVEVSCEATWRTTIHGAGRGGLVRQEARVLFAGCRVAAVRARRGGSPPRGDRSVGESAVSALRGADCRLF